MDKKFEKNRYGQVLFAVYPLLKGLKGEPLPPSSPTLPAAQRVVS